jgi:molybdate transport system substrate-binding protein
MRFSTVALLLLLQPPVADASDRAITVAVASNFAEAAGQVADAFEREHGSSVVLSVGSTGKHYAQIVRGAPFDAFLAADARRPELLEAEGHAVAGSRFTYAIGKLALWSPQPALVDADGQVLSSDRFRFVALANPRLAPYGEAAEQVLRARGLWKALEQRRVLGSNISQAFHFVNSGNAELGFVALSQVRRAGAQAPGSLWLPPQSMYTPIDQQAVLLSDRPSARAFLDYLGSDSARSVIRGHGYETP